jgi:Tfp pilus tip-associated adhesin PilY1
MEGGISCADNLDCIGVGPEECYARDGESCVIDTDCAGIGAEECVAGRCAVGKCAVGVCASADSAWAVFVGSGYSETSQATKEAYLYGFSVHDQTDIWDDGAATPTSINRIKITSAILQDDALASPLLVDLHDDNISDVLYIGNLYGSMYRAAKIGKGETPIISKLFDLGRSDHKNSIRVKADFAYSETDADIWVYFGTGRYETSNDKVTMDQQYFVGLQDNDALRHAAESSGDATYNWNAALDVLGSPSESIKEIEAKKIVISEFDDNAGSYRIIKNCTDTSGSWILKLDNTATGMVGSERVISQPLVVGGIVFFTTFIPDENVCAGNGEAWLYALDYKTGCPSDKAVFDINGDGSFGDPDRIPDGPDDPPYQVVGIYIGEGQPSRPVLEDDILFVTTTGGGLVPTKVNLPANKAKLRSWRDR